MLQRTASSMCTYAYTQINVYTPIVRLTPSRKQEICPDRNPASPVPRQNDTRIRASGIALPYTALLVQVGFSCTMRPNQLRSSGGIGVFPTATSTATTT